MTTTLAIDTSVAIPLLVRTHAAHEAVAAWWSGRRIALADALIALAAREHGAVLATRDARARMTDQRVGVQVEIPHAP